MKRGETMHADLKERALEELKLYWFCTMYLFFALGSFMLYRRLVLAEAGIAYLHYGIAAIEAMVIAKVVLIGRALHLGTRVEGRPLVIAIAYKSILFGLVVLLFGVVEHVVTGFVEKRTWAEIVRHIEEIGIYELLARVLMMMIAFVPMFAFWELSRTMGAQELRALLFGVRRAASKERT